MQTGGAREEYQKQKETAEFPHGHAKYNLKFTQFIVRGVFGSQTEGDLLSFSHNSKRIWYSEV